MNNSRVRRQAIIEEILAEVEVGKGKMPKFPDIETGSRAFAMTVATALDAKDFTRPTMVTFAAMAIRFLEGLDDE